MFGKELIHDVSIFFCFEAAGAVDEKAARFNARSGLVEQVELGVAEALDFLGLNAPTQVYTTAHDAGVGAGSIDEDFIVFVAGRNRGICDGLHARDAEASAVFLNQLNTFRRNIICHDPALVLDELGDERGLATGRSAEIENGLAGLGVEFAYCKQRAGILNVKPTIAKALQSGERWMGFQFERQILAGPAPCFEIVVDVLESPLFDEFGGVGAEGVDACVDARWRVVPLHQLCGAVCIPAILPAFEKPSWVRVAKRGIVGFQVGE